MAISSVALTFLVVVTLVVGSSIIYSVSMSSVDYKMASDALDKKGQQGDRGLKGDKGDTGLTGSPAPQPSPGMVGTPGARGSTGPVGSPAPTNAITAASNGLNIVGNTVKLGGTLIETTVVDQGSHELHFMFNGTTHIHNGADVVFGIPGAACKISLNGWYAITGVIIPSYPDVQAVTAVARNDSSEVYAHLALPGFVAMYVANNTAGTTNTYSVTPSGAAIMIQTGNLDMAIDGGHISMNSTELYVYRLVEDTNNSTDRIIVQDSSNGQVKWIDKSTIGTYAKLPVLVYIDSFDPSLATTFDTVNPPVLDDPGLESNIDYWYLGDDSTQWRWDGSAYVFTNIVLNLNDRGSFAFLTSSVAQTVENPGDIHVFDAVENYGGRSVYFNIATNLVTIRQGGTFRIMVMEKFVSGSGPFEMEIGIYADGVLIPNSEGQLYIDTYPSSNPAMAVITTTSNTIITVRTISADPLPPQVAAKARLYIEHILSV